MMNKIQVSCDPSAENPVTCVPTPMDMPMGTNEIQWVMASGQAGQVSAINWLGEPPPFTQFPNAENHWTAVDNNTNPTGSPQIYAYNAGVTIDGVQYLSDPEIANDPGTGAVRYGGNVASAETPSE